MLETYCRNIFSYVLLYWGFYRSSFLKLIFFWCLFLKVNQHTATTISATTTVTTSTSTNNLPQKSLNWKIFWPWRKNEESLFGSKRKVALKRNVIGVDARLENHEVIWIWEIKSLRDVVVTSWVRIPPSENSLTLKYGLEASSSLHQAVLNSLFYQGA